MDVDYNYELSECWWESLLLSGNLAGGKLFAAWELRFYKKQDTPCLRREGWQNLKYKMLNSYVMLNRYNIFVSHWNLRLSLVDKA